MSKKPRRPRPVAANPFSIFRKASKAQSDRVMTRFLTALEAIARGEHPGEAEWRDLSDAINTIETLAIVQRKLDREEIMPMVNEAIAAMVGASERFKAGHGMRLDGAGLKAMRTVLDVYHQCLDGLTEHEMAQAQAETERRMHALLSGRGMRPSHQVISL